MPVAFLTGASGFVGAYLIRELESRGYDVVAPFVDVTDSSAISAAIASARPDVLLHLAGITRPGSDDVDAFYRINVDGARHVLDAVEHHAPTCRVLMVGSAYAYGRYDRPIAETDLLVPLNHYGVSKAAADHLAGMYAGRGLHVIRARPFNHSGPGQPPDFLVPTLVAQAAAIRDGGADHIIHLGNLDAVRDYCDVRDVVRGYAMALDAAEPGEILNFGSGHGVSVRDAYDLVITAAGITPELVIEPARIRADDLAMLVADTRHAHDAIGWTTHIPLEQTIADMLAAARRATAPHA